MAFLRFWHSLSPFGTDQLDQELATAPTTRNDAGRFDIWRYAIRDAYVALLPITVIGALALSLSESIWLLSFLHIDAENLKRAQDWLSLIYRASFGVMGLLGAIGIAGRLSLHFDLRVGHRNQSQLAVAALAGTVFLIMVFFFHPVDYQGLGYSSVFQSMIAGVATAEIMCRLQSRQSNHFQLHQLERGASLGDALSMTLNGFWTLLIIFIAIPVVGWILLQFRTALEILLVPWMQQHLNSAYLLNPLLILVNQVLWSAGINGGQLLISIANSSYGFLAPADTVFSATQASLIVLNNYGHLGGAGATWGLILCILIRGRDHALHKLAWYSIIPAIFNVNELLLFGVPLVLGRAMLLPFILAPLLTCTITLLAHSLGWLSLQGSAVTWSTPVILSGYLSSGSIAGCLVQIFGIAASALVYAPGLKRYEERRQKTFKENFNAVLNKLAIQGTPTPNKAVDRYDAVGAVAKRLLHDFRNDLGTPAVYLSFQPQHDTNGAMVGVEALLRWQHKEFGNIVPTVIVNLAEETGLIHVLGEWALNECARYRRTWRDQGWNFAVSVNVSPLQLENDKFPELVQAALQRHRLDATDLHLEITEAQNLSTSAATENTLARLQAMGISMEIDDFGMGSTSLLYMLRFKVAAIKLDGVLTRLVIENQTDRDIIQCICRLGRSQGVKVVAEYVESEPQKQLLESLGCDLFQGWHYSSALKPQALIEYARSKASQVSRPTESDSTSPT
jgi:lactose/cellobiose-specific phosphotransferase system IIC component